MLIPEESGLLLGVSKMKKSDAALLARLKRDLCKPHLAKSVRDEITNKKQHRAAPLGPKLHSGKRATEGQSQNQPLNCPTKSQVRQTTILFKLKDG